MKRRIVICGYPKSGNTWLTRLTAEIVGCPVAGFWGEPENKEEAIEGLDRESAFECYKAHHDLAEYRRSLERLGNGSEKLIYVYRDPRDVVVSMSGYFELPWLTRPVGRVLKRVPLVSAAYKAAVASRGRQLDFWTQTLLDGTAEITWLGAPWGEHVTGYLDAGSGLAVRYEDLKSDAVGEARRISDYLGLERTDEELTEATRRQSFAVRKKGFLEQGQVEKAAFLRAGRSGGWKEMLSAENVGRIESELGVLMERLGYGVSNR